MSTADIQGRSSASPSALHGTTRSSVRDSNGNSIEDLLAQLDQLEIQLGTLSVKSAAAEVLRGTDVPVNAWMSISWSGPRSYDCTIALFEAGADKAAIKIAINRPFNSSKGRFTNAVALLYQGPEDPLRVSVSGWSQAFESGYQLSNKVWTPKVFSMCADIGHTLAKDFRDQGVCGRFNACHAEKQLLAVAYYDRGQSTTKVGIHVNWEMCPDCTRCVKAFVRSTRLEVLIVVDGRGVLYKPVRVSQ